MDQDAPIQEPDSLADVLSRGLVRYYLLDRGGGGGALQDMCIQRHPNGLLVLGLAPSHGLLTASAPRVREVQFREEVSEHEAYGKRGRGGANLLPQTVLADIVLEDGSQVQLQASLEARLIELNAALREQPQLLQSCPEDEGFVAILQPKRPQDAQRILKNLLDGPSYSQQRPGHLESCRHRLCGTSGPAWAAVDRDELPEQEMLQSDAHLQQHAAVPTN